MIHPLSKLGLILFAAALPLTFAATPTQDSRKKIKIPRTTVSFEGGIFFKTDGDVSENTCFRLAGQLTAPQFFDHFVRVDSESGTEFRSGDRVLTQFPARLTLIANVYDFPCLWHTISPAPRVYLTRETMAALRWGFYWKRGVDLRPVGHLKPISSTVEPVLSYAGATAHELSDRFKWTFQFSIPSEGVPLTDSLVLVLRTADGRIAARVAARL
ncbi:MAG: hypothetical protein NVS9B4_05060 [Candidatus Acidiferrum sp.]